MKEFTSCITKQEEIKKLFAGCNGTEGRYQKIIDLGKKLHSFPEELKAQENIVQGCQSVLYVASSFKNGLISFKGSSDALISSGLAYLLIYVYSNEPPECVLKCPPQFLEDIGIPGSLSPSRSNGLSSLFLRMQQEALKHLLHSSK